MFNTLTRMGASNPSGYEIERSLRFNHADSAYLSRTPSSAGNRKTFTLSFWFKPTPYFNGRIFEAGSAYGANGSALYYSDEKLGWIYDTGPDFGAGTTTTLFRDGSAWYHVCFQIDTTQGTAANRVKTYVNNTLHTMSSYPGHNLDLHLNNNIVHSFGRRTYQTDNYISAYFAEVHFIDGSVVAPTAFAETNDDTGQWIPKEYEGGSYGTNGFYLKFDDNSNTTSGTLGKDSAGSNDWTPNNFSVAAGTGCDSMTDTPTNNFPTFNPLNGRPSYWGEFTNGSLDCHLPNGSYSQFASTTMAMKSGKWYWEVTVEDSGANAAADSCMIGVSEPLAPWASQNPTNKRRHYQKDGTKITGDSDSNTTAAYGASFTDGDVIGVALDLSAGTLTMYKNGSTQGVLDTTMVSAMTDNGWNPDVHGYASPNFSINFGQRAFAHTPPAGHQKLCTKNIPTPTIRNGSKYFGTLLYESGSSNGTFTFTDSSAVDFFPDLTWIKCRDAAEKHWVMDSVRGNVDIDSASDSKWLNPDSSEVEGNGTNFLDGTTVSAVQNGLKIVETSIGNGEIYFTNRDYVVWNWKESAAAGFDIVSYTGNGSARTISHSLGVKPEFILLKNRDVADGWQVQHKSKGATHTQQFDGAGVFEDTDSVWNDTEPTSSVFSVKDDDKSNANGEDYIAYLWSSVEGYSKVGTYTGNGNNDGTFVLTGFKPAFVMIKCSSHAESWNIFDNKRDPDNYVHHLIAPDTSTEENSTTTARRLDFVSSGFKMRGTNDTINGSNKTYLYLAFAETPFKYATAR